VIPGNVWEGEPPGFATTEDASEQIQDRETGLSMEVRTGLDLEVERWNAAYPGD